MKRIIFTLLTLAIAMSLTPKVEANEPTPYTISIEEYYPIYKAEQDRKNTPDHWLFSTSYEGYIRGQRDLLIMLASPEEAECIKNIPNLGLDDILNEYKPGEKDGNASLYRSILFNTLLKCEKNNLKEVGKILLKKENERKRTNTDKKNEQNQN